ncbi:MAG: SH3 domain-containing protein [Candidatus Promineifilaceae bacterium]
MSRQMKSRWSWIVFLLPAILFITGCAEPASAPANEALSATAEPAVEELPSPTATTEPTMPPATAVPTATNVPEPEEPEEPAPSPTPDSTASAIGVHVHLDENVLFDDQFTDITSGWPGPIEFDNYYIGYHEPEYYHVEVHEPNDKAIVALPGFEFNDMTAEVEVFTDSPNTAQEGDFRYGLALRRSGNQYYAFMISPTTKTWQVIKSSPSGLTVLDEGTDESIHDFDESDMLRIDANGPVFTFHIDGQPVSQIEDGDYASGDLALIVETFNSPRAHIHYDALTVRELSEIDVLYKDKFTDITSGWPGTTEFGNYYIGYHEPEYYHVEVHEPNDKAIVALPGFEFNDMTAEVEVFTDSPNTAQEGDFRYGLALRRSGNQYYAFMISPTTKTWQVIKSSPSGLTVLDEGTDESIHDFDESDMLRIDANGPVFTFHIDGQPVSQIEDGDYASGDLALIVETFDSPRAHIHYDTLTVREPKPPQISCMVDILVLNLREGPGLSYPAIERLSNGTRLLPGARSENNLWIQVQVEGTGESGWVASYEPYVTCNFPVTDLPES